eukprot:gene14296-15808_t
MRQLSLSLLIAIIVLLLTGSEGWKALHSLPMARVSTRSLLQRNDLLPSSSVMIAKPSVLFATASPSTNTMGHNPLMSFLQAARAKFRSFVALIVRRFRYLMMTFVLSLSMIVGGSLSMARARESAAQSPAFSVVAARSGTQPQLHRMKEMKKSRMQRQQQQKQQQKASSSNQKKAQAPTVVKSSPNNNNNNKTSQKTSPPTTTTTTKTNTNTKTNAKTTPQKSTAAVKDNNKAVTETQATSGDGFVVSKEFYDKIGIAAVAASLIPLVISFQKDKDTPIPANKVKGKQLSATSATKKTAAPRPLTSTRAKEDEEGEEDDDDDNDESDADYIDKQTQKTLSVKDYLNKKRQEESDEASSERMVNPYLRSKLSPGSKGRTNDVSQSFEEFVEENPDVEGMVKEGVRDMRSSQQQRTDTNPSTPSTTTNSLKRMRVRESEREEKKQFNIVEKEEVKEEEVEDIPLPYAAVIAAPEESIIPDTPTPYPSSDVTTASTKIAPPPPPPKKSGNFLTRLFQKPGGGRPSDLRSALLREKDDTTSLRLIIGRGLMQYVSPELGRRIAKDFPALTENFPPESNDVVLQEVVSVAEELGLAAADTAEIFAEVTNAFVVQLVDRAVSALDGADSDNDSDEVDGETVAARQRERVVRRLDELTNFMNDVTPLFLAVVKNTASVEPLQYNGKASRQRLEQLFELYLKEAQGLAKQSFSFPLMGDQTAEDDASKPSAEELERLINERNDRLAKVQFLLAIKENKRTSLEQKLMKEEIAAMSKSFGGLGGEGGSGSSGGGGGLGDLLGGLGGLGGGKGGFPGLGEKEMKEMNELMKNIKPEQLEEAMKNIKPEQLEEAMSLLQSKGMPDLSKMKPDELVGVVKREVKSMKATMDAGTISLEEIAGVEQQLGSSLEDFLSKFNSQQMGKLRQNDTFGFSEIVDTLEEMLEVKKKLLNRR